MTTDRVTRSVTVPLTPDAAFALFVGGFDTWWPRDHCICGEHALERVFVDLSAGHWGEVAQDGTVRLWGGVADVAAPTWLVLRWQMDPRVSPWVSHLDPGYGSLIEVDFSGDAAGTTLTLTHHGFHGHADGATIMADIIIGKDRWRDWLADYEAAAQASAR